MGKPLKILMNRKGDAIFFIFIIVFVIITLSAIIIEYFRIDSVYQQVEYELQRGANSSVEYAMLDEYRRDGTAKMDTTLAEEALCNYLHESMKLDQALKKNSKDKSVYELELQSITTTDIPPKITMTGLIITRSTFSFLTGEIKLPFTISSSNNRIE